MEALIPLTMLPALRFTLQDVERAADIWNANCGPVSVAAISGLTLEELRPHLGDFEKKRYTNPTLMWEILRNAGITYHRPSPSVCEARIPWPSHGLARVQWEGPWTAPRVPIAARYRHTHWVASWKPHGREHLIFDINCMCVGGWVSLSEWSRNVVPWLLRECEPKASGKWHLTHVVEIERAPVHSDLWDPHGDVERDWAGCRGDAEDLPVLRGGKRSVV